MTSTFNIPPAVIGRSTQSADSSSITPAPDAAKLQSSPKLGGAQTCDGGHGVFTCTQGSCFYDSEGMFGCCENTADCTPITTCIPGYTQGVSKKCDPSDRGCTSCPRAGPSNCYTIKNPLMTQTQIACSDRIGKESITFFHYDTMTAKPDLTSSATLSPQASLTANTTTASTSMDTVVGAIASAPPPATSTAADPRMNPKTAGGIVVGAVAGAATVALFLWLLFKWCQVRRREQGKQGRGVGSLFRGRRRDVNNDVQLDGTNERPTGTRPPLKFNHDNASTQAISPYPRRSMSPKKRANGEDYREPGICRDLSSIPPPVPPKRKPVPHTAGANTRHCCKPLDIELSAYPETHHPSTSMDTAAVSPVSPTFHFDLANGRESPPFTATPSPVSPIFSDRNVSTTATAGSSTPNFGEFGMHDAFTPQPTSLGTRAKSSELLSVAGPFLSAEQALGQGYWEAEKEQLAADEVMKAREEKKMGL